MKKGFEWSVGILIAIIFAIAMAGIFWAGLMGKTPPVADASAPVDISKGCNNANNCLNSLDGAQCLVIYPGDFTSFCGCLESGDCLNRRSGVCGSNSKCI